MENKIDIVSPDSIKPYIYEVRGRNVMIDRDLATLYGIETKNLKRAVRMNIARFPADFMFELTKEEYDFLRCNFFTLKNGRGKIFRIFISQTAVKIIQQCTSQTLSCHPVLR